jgi:hypothetical protein
MGAAEAPRSSRDPFLVRQPHRRQIVGAVRRLACAPRRAAGEGLCPPGARARPARSGHACRWLRSDPTVACRKMGRGDVLLGPHEQGTGIIGTIGGGIIPMPPMVPMLSGPRGGDEIAVVARQPWPGTTPVLQLDDGTRAGDFVLRRQSHPEMGHGDLFLRAHGGRDLCPGSALDTLF